MWPDPICLSLTCQWAPGCPHLPATVHSAAVDVGCRDLGDPASRSSGRRPRGGIAGSRGGSVFNYGRPSTLFPRQLHRFPPQRAQGSTSPRPRRNLFLVLWFQPSPWGCGGLTEPVVPSPSCLGWRAPCHRLLGRLCICTSSTHLPIF